MSILNYFKAVSISVKMQKLYKRINEKAAIMRPFQVLCKR